MDFISTVLPATYPEQMAFPGPVSAVFTPDGDSAGKLTLLEFSFVLEYPAPPDLGLLFHCFLCILGRSGRRVLIFMDSTILSNAFYRDVTRADTSMGAFPDVYCFS